MFASATTNKNSPIHSLAWQRKAKPRPPTNCTAGKCAMLRGSDREACSPARQRTKTPPSIALRGNARPNHAPQPIAPPESVPCFEEATAKHVRQRDNEQKLPHP